HAVGRGVGAGKGVGTPARGQTAPPPPLAPRGPPILIEAPDTFATMDRNGDRVISRGEWRSDLMPGPFARVDRNHDGVITRDEFANPLPLGSAEARFGDLDQDNDGVLTRCEWVGERLAFDRVDRNQDGRVTVDEDLNPLPVSSASWMESRFEQRDRNRDGVLTRNEWRNENVSFDRADRNRDGVVTLREYLVAPVVDTGTPTLRQRFYSLDRNRNGSI